MQCPTCRAPDSRVIDSRLGKDGDTIRRRRECERCEYRFTTYERVERRLPMVVKKDGRRQAFDRAKIVSGLTRACEKRPVSTDTIETLASQIETTILERGESEATSSEIGEAVIGALHDLDAVAYVRFASVYREFRDVHEFMRELEELIAARSAAPRGAKRSPAPRRRRRARK
jgi:transcriptional repressor NrdR